MRSQCKLVLEKLSGIGLHQARDPVIQKQALQRFFAIGVGRRLSVQNPRRIANILRAMDDASRAPRI